MTAVKSGVALAKATFKDFSDDEATFKAAALAYYTVFALPPLLVLLLQVASMIWDPAEVRSALTGEFGALMGEEVKNQVTDMITSAEQRTNATGWRLALGIGGLIFGATGAFVSLQSALNRAWEVQPDPEKGGIMNFVMKRFLYLGMVLGIAFLMLVSLALTSVLSAAGGMLFGGLPAPVSHVINFALTFVVITVLFAAMFKILPDAKVAWRDVWVGAVMTAVLFVVGKFLIGFYIGRSDPGSAFGAAGALAILLVWIYYAAVIVLLGAEFTQAWIKHRGGNIEPEEGAVRIIENTEHVDSSGRRKPADKDDGRSEGGDRGERAARPGLARDRHDGRAAREAKRDAARTATRSEPESIVDVQRELDATRARMSDVIAELDARVAGAVQAVRRRTDVIRLVRQHPWPAVAGAFAAGAAIAATGTDGKAVEAATSAAKSAPGAASTAATGTVQAVKSGATHLVHAIAHRGKEEEHQSDSNGDSSREHQSGIRGRIRAMLAHEAHFLGRELGRAADELVRSITAPRHTREQPLSLPPVRSMHAAQPGARPNPD